VDIDIYKIILFYLLTIYFTDWRYLVLADYRKIVSDPTLISYSIFTAILMLYGELFANHFRGE